MFFSIVIACYNSSAYIEKAILSVLNQTFNNYELIIIDGASTDGTLNILQKYSSKIKFISEKDSGVYDAMNKALKIAEGDFIFFLGSDDTFFDTTVLEKVAKKISNKDSVYYGDVYVTKIRKLYWGKFSSYKLAIGNISHQSLFYPKCIYKKYQYNLSYKILADYVYNLSIYKRIPFTYIDETICIYSYEGISSTKRDELFLKNIDSIIVKELGITHLIARKIYHLLVRIKTLIKNG